MLPEPILLLGSSGQIGAALKKTLGKNVISPSSKDVDLGKPDGLASALAHYQPKLIINAAACTSVDAIEAEESSAHLVNADSVKVLAALAKSRQIPFVHFSTDYVFNGGGDLPWNESDITDPLNAYGRTKLAGEEAIIEVGGRYLIFRTSWIYNETGKNFVNTMLRLGSEKEVISVVDDQVGSPSYATDIAKVAVIVINSALAKKEFPSGIYHVCNKGYTSWFEFAEKIFEQAVKIGVPLKVREVKPIKTADYPTAATRPLNSRLDTTKLADTFGVVLPHWQDALNRCFANIKKINKEKNASNKR